MRKGEGGLLPGRQRQFNICKGTERNSRELTSSFSIAGAQGVLGGWVDQAGEMRSTS